MSTAHLPPTVPPVLSLSAAALIPGANVPPLVKQTIASLPAIYATNVATARPGFAAPVGARIQITEVALLPNPDEPGKREARVVCELTVEEDMLNGVGSMHGACAAYIIDNCTALPIVTYALVTGRKGGSLAGGVSQSMNIVYHAPAMPGDTLRVISTTVAVGSRIMSARCEIWDVTRSRLVASAVHIKMEPSTSKMEPSASKL